MSIRKLQYGITLGALVIALVHLIWPNLTIDGITLALLVIALIPWLAPLFKSVELPGGWKVEFQELQKTEERAKKAGLLSEIIEKEEMHTFQMVADEDPNLALAGLRIEIEKRLIKLAEITVGLPRIRGVGGLLHHLSNNNIISLEERSVLADMTGLMNSAVHGASVNQEAAQWAMSVGPKLLAELDIRIDNASKK